MGGTAIRLRKVTDFRVKGVNNAVIDAAFTDINKMIRAAGVKLAAALESG